LGTVRIAGAERSLAAAPMAVVGGTRMRVRAWDIS
jgi:hypothetical protein